MSASTFICIFAMLISTASGHFEEGERPEPNGPFLRVELPITKEGIRTLDIVTKHLGCTVDQYFEMSGVTIPKGGECKLDKKGQKLSIVLNREGVEVSVMLIGDIMLYSAGSKSLPQRTEKELLERYTWGGDQNLWWSVRFYGQEPK